MGSRRNSRGSPQGNQSGAINGNDATAGGAIPSPPVVAFDTGGNVVAGWGNATLIQTGPAYGFAAYLPQGAHGCYVDYQGYVWLGGNGDGIVQKYNPATANTQRDMATFAAQIGTKAAAHYVRSVAPGETVTIRLRLSDKQLGADALDGEFDRTFAVRQLEADEFYGEVIPEELLPDAKATMRQAFSW